MTVRSTLTAVVIALSIAVGGCATVGNQGLSDPNLASKLVEHKTKMTEVQAMLGDPQSTFTDNKGDTHWFYTLAKSSLISGTDSTNLSLRFHDGVLAEKSLMKPHY